MVQNSDGPRNIQQIWPAAVKTFYPGFGYKVPIPITQWISIYPCVISIEIIMMAMDVV